MYLNQAPQQPAAQPPGILTQLTQAVPALVQAYRERMIMKAQMKRAQAGLPPLAMEEYTPPVRVQAGLDPKTLLLLALPVGALAVFLLLRRRN